MNVEPSARLAAFASRIQECAASSVPELHLVFKQGRDGRFRILTCHGDTSIRVISSVIGFAFQHALGAFHRVLHFQIHFNKRLKRLFQASRASLTLRFQVPHPFQFFLEISGNSNSKLNPFSAHKFHSLRRRALRCDSSDLPFELSSGKRPRFFNPFFLILKSQNRSDFSSLRNRKASAMDRRLENRNFESLSRNRDEIRSDTFR